MRSFFAIACVLTACGGSQKSAAPQRIGYDPELAESCVPDWGDEAPAGLCDKGEEGQWTLPQDDPAHNPIFQVLALEENHRGRSVDEAIVQLTTGIINRSAGPSCGAQMGRWHRAMAYVRLGRWKESFQDFGTVVKEGPNNPFYGFVDEWMALLEPHLPSGVVMTCMVNYDPRATEVSKP
ncbi:MAG TPA: hypothetical protein VL283_05075 [Candidatus Baltobacteraceae bacterium]|nr:hypothetical protein [Candidatus Baltobacteraceae bacterium]